jgi:ankyrin repeat protein
VAATAAKQKRKEQAIKAAAEATVLSNNGQPPEPVLIMIEKRGDFMTRLNNEKEKKQVLAWLQLALPLTHASGQIKTWIKKLLAEETFTTNMTYMQIFAPLQTSCQQELLRIGEPLQKLYIAQQYLQQLGEFMPPIHPTLQEQQLQQPNQKIHLRQDHVLVGLVPSSTMDMETFIGESEYLHAVRLLALALNDRFQTTVKNLVTPLQGDHKGCAIKGDARMRNKALAADDHRNEPVPRPASNIDVVRCCVTFDDPEALKKGVLAVVEHFNTSGHGTGGIGRIKNGFALSEMEAAKSFHYRSYMVNIIVDFGCTYGELMARPEVVAMLETYLKALPENPKQSMYQWRRDATAAVVYLNSAEMSGKPVVMVCEVQFLLRQYLEARKKMHFLYKVARADSDVHLYQQFAVAEKRAEGATLASEELRMVEKTKGEVEEGEELALFNACVDGFVAAVQVALAVEGVDVNQAGESGVTPLSTTCEYGHVDVVRLLLANKEIQINQATKKGTTPLSATCQSGHVDVVRLLLAREEIQVNQAKEDGATPLWTTCQEGHVDVVRLLLARKEIQINQAEERGWTPLSITCRQGHVDVVRLLLARKEIQINQATKKGTTPLFVTCQKGHVDVLRLLLARKEIQINQAMENGATPLSITCQEGHVDVVRLLLANKEIDINQCNNQNVTPIAWASENGHIDIVKLLLAQPNIDIDKQDKWGDTPEACAREKGHTAIVTLFQQYNSASK